MQLIVDLYHRDILECSDAAVILVTGASEAQNISEYCSEPKQMLWIYGLHKGCLTGPKSVTCIFLLQVQCASCVSETESQGNNQYESLKEITGF